MIKFEKTEVIGWEAATRGMRNPMNSWEKMDSFEGYECGECELFERKGICVKEDRGPDCERFRAWEIGPNDLDLMQRLYNSGTDHRKFMRMIIVYVDITAPLYWWKEFDTYKVGTVANSCSTMHKIHAKEFTLNDFSHDHLMRHNDEGADINYSCVIRNPENKNELIEQEGVIASLECLKLTINILNTYRNRYIKTKEKIYWWQMIQLLPSSYNQKRTVMLNYEVLANIYKSRKNHKLDEWSKNMCTGFCDWIETLPYSELITGEFN